MNRRWAFTGYISLSVQKPITLSSKLLKFKTIASWVLTNRHPSPM